MGGRANNEPQAFGALLRRYRVAAGLTQEALAQDAGLSVRGLADLERGARRFPYPDTVQRLVEALALAPSERAGLVAAGRRTGMPRANTRTSSGNLPATLNSFVGREQEVGELRRLLDTARLVTLIGTGGVGKTRLAIEAVSAAAAQFDDGAWWVDLSQAAGEDVVASSIAAALPFIEKPYLDLRTALVERMRSRRALLAIDNCEHVLEAAGSMVDLLLRSCPDLTVLATSREPLDVDGEIAWRVGSLSFPTSTDVYPVELEQFEAAQLFLDRASKRVPGFCLDESNAPAVATICRELEGLPLAIELAAARVSTMTPEHIATLLGETVGPPEPRSR
jgi:transcriptional regulator with XRE-family HTH domain